jgi:hypothetical protein
MTVKEITAAIVTGAGITDMTPVMGNGNEKPLIQLSNPMPPINKRKAIVIRPPRYTKLSVVLARTHLGM